MYKVTELFGSKVFNEKVMKERLPKDIYQALKRTVRKGEALDIDIANVVANAMKDWAIEQGATHFTHWFQPLTGITAEKHDSFISPLQDGSVSMEFSGKDLIKGEPDASSFPSGGLRATFEARGYTAWDPTSYAFIKENTLCIPTAFYSYGGEVLDKKTPLLRSIDAISTQGMRILRLFGNTDAARVTTTVGPEQEYFLISKEDYLKRKDLIYTGRTLLGAKPPKGQELEDHYFGSIKPRVKAFMKELNEELWALGISAKTEHNEVAPAQHELAPVFTTTNQAADHNQLTMELMKKVAERHGMVCLLHEKPFAGINGSGKHNNWSMSTDTGVNLLEPGNSPYENAQFLLFLTAVIKAVDEYQDMLRITVASAGNDHRLGANEAPPAIVSVFLGEELEAVLEAIEKGTPYNGKKAGRIEIGVDVLPKFPKDTTDRNRTSPFAFTGNKFEFRMPGSSFSVSDANTVLNTITAQSLKEFADILEKAGNFEETLHSLIKDTLAKHKRIIFNGNNYTEEWVKEAEKRGLSNLKSTPEALAHFCDEKNIKLFTAHGIFTEIEMDSRSEILFDNYSKTIAIEAYTMAEMIKRDVAPAVISYAKELSETIIAKKTISGSIDYSMEQALLEKISALGADMYKKLDVLEKAHSDAKNTADIVKQANCYHDRVVTSMSDLRTVADELETLVGAEYWPYPSYGKLLFGIN